MWTRQITPLLHKNSFTGLSRFICFYPQVLELA